MRIRNDGLATWIVIAAWPLTTVGYVQEVWRIVSRLSLASTRWSAFLWGLFLFPLLWLIFRKFFPCQLLFFTTLEHEFTHLLVGLLFFKSPVAINVTATDGGSVMLKGSNIWITLAPYYLPTTSLLLLPLGLWQHYQKPVRVALGMTFSYHLLSQYASAKLCTFGARLSVATHFPPC